VSSSGKTFFSVCPARLLARIEYQARSSDKDGEQAAALGIIARKVAMIRVLGTDLLCLPYAYPRLSDGSQVNYECSFCDPCAPFL
jgi:hypothetical protein